MGLMPASSGTASTSRRGSVASIDVGVSHMSGSVELEHDGVEGAAAAVGRRRQLDDGHLELVNMLQ